ncbi:unnamed protein product, partial [Rotaria socialis]
CKGRPCAKCHNCRDWQFTGNHDQWNWVRNFNNWKNEDWKRWSGGDYKLFIKRDGATCLLYDRDYYRDRDYYLLRYDDDYDYYRRYDRYDYDRDDRQRYYLYH